jgi:beta-glucosidase
MAEGLSNGAIADRLVVSIKTVESHIANIFSKLGLHDEPGGHRRVLAVLAALRHGAGPAHWAVGYRWYDAQQIHRCSPFGFGLSYTMFKVDQLRVTPGQLHAGTPVQVHVRVTNTGDRAGTATPQVYLRMPSSLDEPPHRLVATTKVPLAAGESRTVTMTLPRSAYSYWDTDAHAWEVADGR